MKQGPKKHERAPTSVAGANQKAAKRRRDDDKNHWDLDRMPRMLKNGRYKIERIIGKGTFGTVYTAWDEKYHEQVALKIIRSVEKYRVSGLREVDVLKMMYKEMKKLRDKPPKPILKLFSYFEVDPGHLVMVCELLGNSLYDVIRANDHFGFPFSACVYIGAQIVRAVQFLHKKCGYMHTDLKLENIVFTYRCEDAEMMEPKSNYYDKQYKKQIKHKFRLPCRWEIKLIDLGGATLITGKKRGRTINTRQYRCPEVILHRGWEAPSDMWSIGCILSEIYTGELLFGTHDNIEHLALMEKVTGEAFCGSFLGQHENGYEFDDEDHDYSDTERGCAVLQPFTLTDDAWATTLQRQGCEDGESYFYRPDMSILSASSRDYVSARPPLAHILSEVRNGERGPEAALFASYRGIIESCLRLDPKRRATACDASRLCEMLTKEAFEQESMQPPGSTYSQMVFYHESEGFYH